MTVRLDKTIVKHIESARISLALLIDDNAFRSTLDYYSLANIRMVIETFNRLELNDYSCYTGSDTIDSFMYSVTKHKECQICGFPLFVSSWSVEIDGEELEVCIGCKKTYQEKDEYKVKFIKWSDKDKKAKNEGEGDL